MDVIRKYYNKFKMLNPKNTELKLAVIVIILAVMFFNGFSKFSFSWDIVISLCVFIVSMTLHEVAHGDVAYKF